MLEGENTEGKRVVIQDLVKFMVYIRRVGAMQRECWTGVSNIHRGEFRVAGMRLLYTACFEGQEEVGITGPKV